MKYEHQRRSRYHERSVMRGTKQRDPRGTRHDLGKRLEPKLAHGVGECQHMLAPPLGLGADRNPGRYPNPSHRGATAPRDVVDRVLATGIVLVLNTMASLSNSSAMRFPRVRIRGAHRAAVAGPAALGLFPSNSRASSEFHNRVQSSTVTFGSKNSALLTKLCGLRGPSGR